MKLDGKQLLPCPFCGGEAEIKKGVDSTQGREPIAWVECKKCGCCTKKEIEWENDCIGVVVSLWNTRKD